MKVTNCRQPFADNFIHHSMCLSMAFPNICRTLEDKQSSALENEPKKPFCARPMATKNVPVRLPLLLLFIFVRSSLQSECGGNITLQSNGQPVTVVSPNYPQPYPNNARCLWLVTSMSNSVQLTVDHYDVEDYGLQACPDNLTISTPDPYMNIGCGVMPNIAKFGSLRTPFQFMINFSSDDRIQRVGFSLTLTGEDLGAAEQSMCGKRLRLRQINRPLALVSNNWPFNFPSSSSCQWTVVNNVNDSMIRVDIIDMNLDGDSWLQIENGTNKFRYNGSPLFGNRTMRFKGPSLDIRFSSTTQWYNGRFKLLVSAVPIQVYHSDTVLCPGRQSTVSIDYRQLCDGRLDCEDGMDESLSICQTVHNCGKQKLKPNIIIDDSSTDNGMARSGTWPWMATVHKTGVKFAHRGNAVLISPMWLLTSADTLNNSPSLSYHVRLGSKYAYSDQEPWSTVEHVAEVYAQSSDRGLALLRLNRSLPLPFSDYINTACLPYSLSEDDFSSKCATITISKKMHQYQARRYHHPEEDKIWVRYPGISSVFSDMYYPGAALTCRIDNEDRGWKVCGLHMDYSNRAGKECAVKRVSSELQFIYQTMLDAEYYLQQQTVSAR